MADAPDVLTITEAAAVLRVCVSTAKKLARRNELPGAQKVGGQWRVNRRALDAYLAGSTPPP